MSIEPINGVRTTRALQGVKRVSRRASDGKTEEASTPDVDTRPKASNPPGVGENLDVTV